MGVLLICPHCLDKAPITAKTCGQCGANLRDLPPESRRYFVGRPEEAGTAPPALELSPEPILEEVEVELMEPYPETMMPEASLPESKDVSLCEALDRILNKGAVLFGEVMISVADIDLVYLGLQVILASMETARGFKPGLGEGQLGPNLFDKGEY
jgi:ribosomal protein L40E